MTNTILVQEKTKKKKIIIKIKIKTNEIKQVYRWNNFSRRSTIQRRSLRCTVRHLQKTKYFRSNTLKTHFISLRYRRDVVENVAGRRFH